MSIETLLPIRKELVTAISSGSGEPAWMLESRLQALKLAAQLDLPKLEKTHLDRWPLEAFGDYRKAASADSAADLPEAIAHLLNDRSLNLVVQRNSGVVFSRLSDQLARQGVVFTDLHSALQTHGDLIRKHFMTAVSPDEDRLTALHAALWSGGVFLHVPRDVAVEVPLQAVFLNDGDGELFSPHVLVIAEANSRVTYVDNYVSSKNGAPVVHSGAVEVFAKPGADILYATVHNLEANVTDVSYRRARLENDANMQWVVGEMNRGSSLSDTTSLLQGNGSNADTKLICVGTGEQRIHIATRNVHVGRNTTSDMTSRAVMRDESTAIINGITKIEKGAVDANGQQTEKVLMLSDQARGDANPMLLIDENEVQAGHAASVGQVNEDQVHYLMSRGISREEATRLIIYGFLAPIVSEIPIDQLADQLRTVAERKLGQR